MEIYAVPKLSKYTTALGAYNIKPFTYEIICIINIMAVSSNPNAGVFFPFSLVFEWWTQIQSTFLGEMKIYSPTRSKCTNANSFLTHHTLQADRYYVHAMSANRGHHS